MRQIDAIIFQGQKGPGDLQRYKSVHSSSFLSVGQPMYALISVMKPFLNAAFLYRTASFRGAISFRKSLTAVDVDRILGGRRTV